MIEVKLSDNKHCKIKNEEALIINGEINATKIKVEYPYESENLHKRADFINSEGKHWSVGLYTPEIKEYSKDFDKLNFSFKVPNEVAVSGEVKMQFVAYKLSNIPDEKTIFPFEVIYLWVSDGIMRAKKSSDFDLLYEMAEYCRLAYNQAQASAESAHESISVSKAANEKSDEAVRTSKQALKTAKQSDKQSLQAIDIAKNSEDISKAADGKSDTALAESLKAVELSEEAVGTANKADGQSLEALETAQMAEANSISAETKSDNAVADAAHAAAVSQQALNTANAADSQSLSAFTLATNAVSVSNTANATAAEAFAESLKAITLSETAVNMAEQADAQSLEAIETAQRAEANSISAEAKSDNAVADSTEALNTAREAKEQSGYAEEQALNAMNISENAERMAHDADSKSDTALTVSGEALIKSETAIDIANRADSQSLQAIDISQKAEGISKTAEDTATAAFSNSLNAVNTANDANNTAKIAETNSLNALAIINDANSTAKAADDKANAALIASSEAKDTAANAKTIAEQAKSFSLDADGIANQAISLSSTALGISKAADTKAEIAVIDSATALSKSNQALHYAGQAAEELAEAKYQAQQTNINANEAKTLAWDAKSTADSTVLTANNAYSKANDAEIVASDAKVSASAAKIAADWAAQAAEDARQSAQYSEQYAHGLNNQIIRANETADNAVVIANLATEKIDGAVQIAERAEALVASKQDELGYVPEDIDNKNQADGYAGLDANGKIPLELINDAMLGNVQYQGLWDAADNVPDLTAVSPKGHYYVAENGGTQFGITFEVGDWIISDGIAWDRVYNTDAVSSVAGRTGNVVLFKSDVGLSNVDNISDVNKPISTATQTALNNKVDKISGKGLSTEDFSTAEKTKLAGITDNANNYIHPANHAPSVISQDASNRFTTDAEKAAWNAKAETTQATTTADGLMSAADKIKLNGITAGAAVTGVKGDSEATYRTGNVNITKANVGLGSVDNTSDASKPVSTAMQTALNNKVDKVAGKGLSTEDYTTTEKTKLSGIETSANNYAHPANHPASVITQDISNRFVSDTEKSTWNGKAEKTAASQSVAGLMSVADKTKLDGIANGAQVNAVTSVAGRTGAVTLAKGDVGLGNVDNTSDANKPISTATQTELNNKVDKVTGKQLSTEDYTTAEKNKLAGIENGAQVNTVTGIKGNNETSYRTGNVNLTTANIGAEPAFTKNGAFNKDFGTASGTVCQGNDSRLNDARTPVAHASTATTYGAGDASYYGHVKLSSADGGTGTAGTGTVSGDSAVRYHYKTAESDINLNNYLYEGRFTLYNVPTTITDSVNNFPSGWNTGSTNSNTAYLEVRRFYSSSAVHQTLYKRGTIQRWVRYSTSSASWTAWVETDLAVQSKVNNTQRNLGGSLETAGYTFGGGASAAYSNASIALGIYAASNYYMATSMGVYSESYEAASAFGPYAKATALNATALGYSTKAAYAASTAVGQNAATTAANQVQLGNSASTVYYYALSSRSDARDKTDINDCQFGLDFIKKLKPRQFVWDYREDYTEEKENAKGKIETIKHERDGSKKRTRKHYGLIAQEVKQVIDETGADFAGYQDHKVSGGEDILSLNYMELIAPMIKAIQEQQVIIDELKSKVEELEKCK